MADTLCTNSIQIPSDSQVGQPVDCHKGSNHYHRAKDTQTVNKENQPPNSGYNTKPHGLVAQRVCAWASS
jgi:hypothetical protein